MLYLTATDENTGALRILSGSHRGEYHHRLSSLQASHPMLTADPAWPAATFGEAGAALPAHIFAAEPCDAILFSQSCYHAVYGHQPNRTYIALKFAARPRTDEELAVAAESLGGMLSRNMLRGGGPLGRSSKKGGLEV